MADPVALVFDLDGTLIHSAPDIHRTANLVLAAEGFAPLDYETVKGFIGNGVGVLVARILAHLGQDNTRDLHRRMVADFITQYEEAVDLTVLYEGVADCLVQLQARGHRMAICTNKPKAPARAVLDHFGILSFFDVIIGGDSLPVRKPDPASLRAVLTQMGASTCLFVGDSEVDAETAHAAALPFVLFSGGYRKTPMDQMNAAILFDAHRDLPGMIDAWQATQTP